MYPATDSQTSATPPEPRFDADGFLLDGTAWTPELAQRIALREGVPPLQERHLEIVRYIRAHYSELGAFATPRRICGVLDLDKREMQDFFTSCINAWKIAGLPNPGAEARSYMH